MKDGCCFVAPGFLRHFERSFALIGVWIGIGAVFEQQADHFYLSILGRAVQWGKAFCLACVWVGAASQQQAHNFEVLPGCRGVDRLHFERILLRGIDLRAAFQ